MTPPAFQYVGSELATFAKAQNWKGRLRREMSPYLRGKVAEVGAGLGSMTTVLSGCAFHSWLALEPDPGLAKQIPNGSTTDVFVGTLSDLAAADAFDTILYIDVLEHIEDDRRELSTAAARLAPGGRLIVLVPAHNFLFTPFDKAIGHFRRYNKSMLRAVAPASLTLKRLRYLDSVGFFASLANKLLLRQAMPTTSQILFWDRFMVPVSEFTDALLGFRFGKSLLAVWEKPA